MRGLFFGTHFFLILAIGLGFLVAPLFLREFFDAMIEFSGANRTEILPELWRIFLKLFLVYFFGFWVFARVSEWFLCRFVAKFMQRFENLAFLAIIRQSSAFFADNFVGSLVTKMSRFVRALDGMNHLLYFNFCPTVFRFFASAAIIFWFTPKIATILLGWGAVFVVVVVWATKKWKIPLDREVARSESRLSGGWADSISNFLNVKMFAREDFERAEVRKLTELTMTAREKSWTTWVKLNIFQSCMITGLELAVLMIFAEMWVANTVSIGTMVMIQVYLGNIYMNLWAIGQNVQEFRKFEADVTEMIEILNLRPEIEDPVRPEKCRISRGAIEFRNVDFSYEGVDVFRGFSLKIAPGERIGLVGASGAGKSTFVKILCRFAEVEGGEILIDGQNISKIRQDDLRRAVAFVPQESALFHRTILENIRYGRLDASEDEVRKVARSAHADDFVKNLPAEYATRVGERGVKLSGGERQRVAIARAMLKKSPILVLDEATSSLDSVSEGWIQESFEKLMVGRTTIVIAHRLSTLRKMDRILVLDGGVVVESGTHEDLLKKGGKYAELWGRQSGGFV